jgi:DNA-binding winged helix-turn-helix (wHTH) protein
MTAERLRFDRFVLESDSGELWKGQAAVSLQPQPAKLLEALLRASGQVVSREELGKLLWDHRHHVDRDLGINQCVRQIRKALGDEAQEPRFIETVPRRGYRFLQPVQIEEKEPAMVSEHRSSVDRALRRRPTMALVIALALILLATALWRAQAAGSDPGRLAVLPVRNLTGAERWDALSASLSAELTARIARSVHGELEVIARDALVDGAQGVLRPGWRRPSWNGTIDQGRGRAPALVSRGGTGSGRSEPVD